MDEKTTTSALEQIQNYLVENSEELRSEYGGRYLAARYQLADRRVVIVDSDADDLKLIRRFQGSQHPEGVTWFTTLDESLDRAQQFGGIRNA